MERRQNRAQSERRLDPFGVCALAASGTMAAHQIGYLASGGSEVSHSYFAVLGPLVLLAACIAAWVAAIEVLRSDAGRAPTWWVLGGLQAGMFVVMEVGERLSSGSLASLVSVPVVAGLLLQPFVAWIALRVVRVGRRVLESIAAARRRRRVHATCAASMWRRPERAIVSDLGCAVLRLRGPPVG